MLKSEKVFRFDIISEIRKRMSVCFTPDGQFVNSSLARGNANELKKIITENNIDRIIVEDIVAGYLFRNNYIPKSFKDQVNLVLAFFYKN